MDWTKWLFKLLPNIMVSISGPLRAELVSFAKEFKVKAKKTENPWDDLVAEGLCWLVGVDG